MNLTKPMASIFLRAMNWILDRYFVQFSLIPLLTVIQVTCMFGSSTREIDMALIWTNEQGKEITVYASGEAENCNGDAAYIVSKVSGSPFTFLVRKNACRPA